MNYGWVVIVGGFTMHLALGTIYCWGDLSTYATSYLRRFDKTITLDKTLAVFAIASCGIAITMYWGGVIEKKLGPRLTAYLGCGMLVAGVFLTSFAKSLSVMIVLYGLMFGMGNGIAYTAPIICGLKWMPGKKGLISGCVTAGFGLGAFVFNFIITDFCNPDDVQPSKLYSANGKDKLFDPDGAVADRVPKLFMVLGATYAVLTFVGVSLLRDPPKDEADEVAEKFLDDENGDEDANELEGLSTGEVVQSFQGWLLWILFICTACGGVFVIGCYKSYGSKQDWSDDKFLALLGSLISIFNCLGRFFQGMAADRFGFKPVLTCMAAVQTIFLLTFTLAGPHKGMYVLWCCVVAFCYGGNFALYPTATMAQFGVKHAGANYGVIFTAYGIAGIIGTMFKKQLEQAIEFKGITFLMGAICGCGVIGSLMIRKPKKLV
jgi:OFA family oxalate/formate antiporter-like MFS transporter